jgi:alginate O-acetyltransferase complex protein AlgI
MLFNSFLFIGLVILTFSLYYLPQLSRYQILVLIISSLFFYAYNQPILVLLLLFSVSINIVSSYYIVYGAARHKKLMATMGVVLNCLILFFFKYSPLFAKTFLSDSNSVGKFLLFMPLPIGISFFTFQGISLVVDVYKEKYSDNKELVPRSFVTHAKQIMFFKGFFPQLISGPIVKAHDFIPQIGIKRYSEIDWVSVFKNLVLGYFLKMVVADNLKDHTFWISYPVFESQSSLTLVAMLLGFSFQIFADFAGYSLIAIGLAKLFGYHFKDNFNFPYISTSFKEFWKRWHISLSQFLMEYLYIPLGGNKKGKVRTYANLMIVMVLGGLWHGAAWSYAVWGSFHGIALAVERFFSENFSFKKSGLITFINGVIIFSFVTISWLFFKLPNLSHAIKYLECISTNISMPDNYARITYIAVYSSPVFFYHLSYLLSYRPQFFYFKKVQFLFYGMILFLILVNSGSSGAFIYFQF